MKKGYLSGSAKVIEIVLKQERQPAIALVVLNRIKDVPIESNTVELEPIALSNHHIINHPV